MAALNKQTLAAGFAFVVMIYGQSAVTFEAIVPAGTDTVVVIGSPAELGGWDHGSALPLQKQNDSTFSGAVPIRSATEIEYKFTRGSWDKEALTADSTIPGNYHAAVKNSNLLRHRIPFWRDNIIVRPSDRKASIVGTVVQYEKWYSPQLDNTRQVTVWLPPSYAEATSKHYPVLYLHDGQNVFSPGISLSGNEWRLDETATDLITKGLLREIIMVAIDNNQDRTAEYSPIQRGEPYCRFVINTVKPVIDSTYRTLPGPQTTAVMGSSMGGIISFHLAWEYPEIFGLSAALSPAFIVDDEEIVNRVRDDSGARKDGLFIIYNGTEGLESRLQPAITRIIAALEENGYKAGCDYVYRIFDGASHSEADWAEQSRSVLLRFFGESEN